MRACSWLVLLIFFAAFKADALSPDLDPDFWYTVHINLDRISLGNEIKFAVYDDPDEPVIDIENKSSTPVIGFYSMGIGGNRLPECIKDDHQGEGKQKPIPKEVLEALKPYNIKTLEKVGDLWRKDIYMVALLSGKTYTYSVCDKWYAESNEYFLRIRLTRFTTLSQVREDDRPKDMMAPKDDAFTFPIVYGGSIKNVTGKIHYRMNRNYDPKMAEKKSRSLLDGLMD